MKIGNREFEIGKKVYVMGILNVTPDSFSDGGKFNQIEAALEHAEKMIQEGASIIDIGGESTRPGYTPISAEEEIERVVPLILGIKKAFEIPVSIDTYKPEVAEAALKAGADMVNDIWGCKKDERMASLVAGYNVPVCLMHNREEAVYSDFSSDILSDLEESVDVVKNAGVKAENIILDPGIGFAKDHEQNLQAIRQLDEIVGLGYPVLLAASNKSIVGQALNLPVTERREGTMALSVIGAVKGCSFVRVHDVKANIRVLQMTEAVYYG